MYGHQRYALVALILLVIHVGEQHNILQPLLHRGLPILLSFARANLRLALLREELHTVQQLLDILNGTRSLGGAFGAVLRQNTCA